MDDEEMTGLLDTLFVGVRVLGKQALCLTIADELEGPGLAIYGAGTEAENLLDVLQLLVAEVEGAVVGLGRVARAKDIEYFHSIFDYLIEWWTVEIALEPVILLLPINLVL